MLGVVAIVIGTLAQLLLSGILLVFDVQTLSCSVPAIVVAWLALRGSSATAFVAGFWLVLVEASLGGSLRGVPLLSYFAAFSLVVALTSGTSPAGGYRRHALWSAITALVAQLGFLVFMPLFGSDGNFGEVFLRVGTLSVLLTALFAFPIRFVLSAVEPWLSGSRRSGRLSDV